MSSPGQQGWHRVQLEQADNFLEPNITYFGDMVSFFDEIALDLLSAIAPAINIPSLVLARLFENANGAEFPTVTPHGVVPGGKPNKGVGQGRACSCPMSMMPLELIDEMVAATVPGQRHYGRDGNVTATALAKACDDASGTRSGAHAPHHVELLAASNFVMGPIATGLAHSYAMGKTATHASRQEGAALVTDPNVCVPLPDLETAGAGST